MPFEPRPRRLRRVGCLSFAYAADQLFRSFVGDQVEEFAPAEQGEGVHGSGRPIGEQGGSAYRVVTGEWEGSGDGAVRGLRVGGGYPIAFVGVGELLLAPEVPKSGFMPGSVLVGVQLLAADGGHGALKPWIGEHSDVVAVVGDEVRVGQQQVVELLGCGSDEAGGRGRGVRVGQVAQAIMGGAVCEIVAAIRSGNSASGSWSKVLVD